VVSGPLSVVVPSDILSPNARNRVFSRSGTDATLIVKLQLASPIQCVQRRTGHHRRSDLRIGGLSNFCVPPLTWRHGSTEHTARWLTPDASCWLRRSSLFCRSDTCWRSGHLTRDSVSREPILLDPTGRAPVWSGFLAVEHPGRYQFDVVSDDGSQLEIDNRLVVDDGGRHGALLARGAAELKAGLHPIHLRFFQGGGGGWRLDLFWARDGQVPVRIPRSALLLAPLRGWQYAVFKALHDCAPFVPVLWIAAAFALLIRYTPRDRKLVREILSFPPGDLLLHSDPAEWCCRIV